MSGNQALNVNNVVGPQADLAITNHGSDWYFTVCAIMGVATIAFTGMSRMKPQSERIFHYITATITFVACIAYFSMGAGLGQVPILAEFIRSDSTQVAAAGTREIFYVRYIDWVITTPLLLLDLLLTAGLPWPTILVTLLVDEIMIVTGLVGALTSTGYKWAYWVFGMIALFFVAYELLVDGRKHANAYGGSIKSTFTKCGLLTIFLWFLYPIAWGLSEGANVIHPDAEAIFYGILDVFAKPVFGALLLMGHRNISVADLGLVIREPAGLNNTSSKHQKNGHTPAMSSTNGTNGNTNGNTTV